MADGTSDVGWRPGIKGARQVEFLSWFQVCFRFYFYRIQRAEPRGLGISSDSAVIAQALGTLPELAWGSYP